MNVRENNHIAKNGNGLVGIIIFVAVVFFINVLTDGKKEEEVYQKDSFAGTHSYESYDSEEQEYPFPAGFSGTDTMEACNSDSGNCYDLEIDSDGENIERINFPNGGWRDVSYSECDNGYCTVEDEDGTEWELQY